MNEYQVISRKYRPQTFQQVMGQEAIVTTLKNSIRLSRLSHAYLFCGSKGTGKTTLARIFAKAINCHFLSEDLEPCNRCPSCKEIASGSSLDVLEIDGASHRGIEDIRQINETVAYAPQHGKYKIYLIDEVHMLTKEAFNALLKTLEEPPLKVKFFFATTEPQKIPATILSRCQRFNLQRIPTEKIAIKLKSIIHDLGIDAEERALHVIAHLAEGGLRDAEGLLDQVLAFHEGTLTSAAVSELLGLMPKERLFALDDAGCSGNVTCAFEIAGELFSTGKNIQQFIDELIAHFRTHLLLKIEGADFIETPGSPLGQAHTDEIARYRKTNPSYSKEQCFYILDLLIEAEQQVKSSAFKKTALELLLVKIIRSHERIHLDTLIHRLSDLEKVLKEPSAQITASKSPPVIVAPSPTTPLASRPVTPTAALSSPVTEDPSPKETDLPKRPKAAPAEQPPPPKENKIVHLQRKSKHDTLMRFAAKELGGNLKL